MTVFKTIWEGLDWSIITDALLSLIPALLCITFHELSHGIVAYWLGDNTAKNQGRLTLNPIRHIDIMGLISMAVFGFGWAKPVPVDMRNFKKPKSGMAIVALAGPASNIILAFILIVLSSFTVKGAASSEVMYELWYFLNRTAILSIGLAVFNIIPVPPLDGSKILFSFLSEQWYYKLMRYERYGMIIMLALVWSGVLGTPLSNGTWFIYEHMYDAVYNMYSAIAL